MHSPESEAIRETKTDAYPVASLEAATLNNEKLFYSIPEDAGTRVLKSGIAAYPTDTYTNPNDYVHQLSGSGTKIGTSITLKRCHGPESEAIRGRAIVIT